MVRVPFPNQISSVPEIDREALGWSQVLVDAIGKVKISELAFGFGTITWPGVGDFSNVLQVAHGLTKQPTAFGAVFAMVNGLSMVGLNHPPMIEGHAGSGPGGTTIAFQASTTDGQVPLNTATTGFYWLAML